MPNRRKPTEDKRTAGTLRPGRTNLAEPKYPAAAPPKPAWLSRAAAAEWDRIVPLLLERRVLAEVDLGVLAAYCTAVGDLQMASEALKRKGVARYFKSGTLWKEHPAVKACREAEHDVRLLAGELGVSPASRSKVSSIPVPAEENREMTAPEPRRRAPGKPAALQQQLAAYRRKRRPAVPVN